MYVAYAINWWQVLVPAAAQRPWASRSNTHTRARARVSSAPEVTTARYRNFVTSMLPNNLVQFLEFKPAAKKNYYYASAPIGRRH